MHFGPLQFLSDFTSVQICLSVAMVMIATMISAMIIATVIIPAMVIVMTVVWPVIWIGIAIPKRHRWRIISRTVGVSRRVNRRRINRCRYRRWRSNGNTRQRRQR